MPGISARALLLLAACSIAVPCAAATPAAYTITGRVTAGDSTPLAEARLALVEVNRVTTTGADGRYSFAAVPAGTYTLTATRIGFAPVVRRLTIVDGDLTVDLTLKPSVIEVSGVQVTASANATSTLTSPQPTTVTGGAELAAAQAPSLGETLAQVPGVHSLSTGAGIGKPVIRGLTSNRVLVLDDGQRLETQQWGDEHGPNIETADADRIEVIRGPASVLYGSDAIGGVINVIHAELPDAIGRAPFAGGSVIGSYSTNNRQPDGTLTVRGASGGLGFRGSLTGRTSENVRTPDYELWNSGNHAVSGSGALGYRGAWGSLVGTFSRRAERIELTDEDSTATPYQRIGDTRGRLTIAVPVRAARLELSAGLDRNRRREFEDAADPNVALGLLSSTVLGDAHLHHGGAGALSGVIGAAAQRTRFSKFGAETLIPNTTAQSAGAFAFEQLDAGRWSLSAGARFDHKHLDVEDDTTLGVTAQTRHYNSLTGNVGVLFHVTEPVALVLNVGRGYRAPSSFDLFSNGVHEGTVAFERGNPALMNETSFNTDLALRVQSGRVVAEVGGFVNAITDFIYTVPTGTIDSTSGFQIYDVTQGNARLAGFEGAVEFHPTTFLHLRGTADFVRGQNTSTDQALPNMPPLRASAFARLEGREEGVVESPYFSVGLESNARQTRLDPAEAAFFADAFGGAGYQSAPYILVNLAGGFALPAGSRSVRLDFQLRNATNQAFADFLSRLKTNARNPGQGRTLLARVTTEF